MKRTEPSAPDGPSVAGAGQWGGAARRTGLPRTIGGRWRTGRRRWAGRSARRQLTAHGQRRRPHGHGGQQTSRRRRQTHRLAISGSKPDSQPLSRLPAPTTEQRRAGDHWPPPDNIGRIDPIRQPPIVIPLDRISLIFRALLCAVPSSSRPYVISIRGKRTAPAPLTDEIQLGDDGAPIFAVAEKKKYQAVPPIVLFGHVAFRPEQRVKLDCSSKTARILIGLKANGFHYHHPLGRLTASKASVLGKLTSYSA